MCNFVLAPSFVVSHIPRANIESSPVWDTSCLAELIYDVISLVGSFLREVSQTGDDSIFVSSGNCWRSIYNKLHYDNHCTILVFPQM